MKDDEITSITVADFFLSKSNLTPKKLQKLVYYAYAWFVALNNENPCQITEVLFDERPEAWMHGPVFPKLYQKYKSYGWHEIPKKGRVVFKNKDVESFLGYIWKKFNKYSADELEYMTHQESPWLKAKTSCSSNLLDNSEIFVYFNEEKNKK